MNKELIHALYQKCLKVAERLLRSFAHFLQRLTHRKTVELIKKELNPIRTYNGEPIMEKLSFDEYRRLGHQIRNYNRFITRAAIALINEDNEIISVYSVASPGHHAEVLFYMSSIGLNEEDLKKTRQDSGFLDNYGIFVNRKEGADIAQAAKQILVKEGAPEYLFSEQMWVLTDENPVFRKHYRFNQISKFSVSLMKAANKLKYNW